MRILAALALSLSSSVALAQSEEDRRSARDFENDIVREIERGPYVRANIGVPVLFNTHGDTRAGPDQPGPNLFSGVIGVALGVGADVVDRERFSLSVEGQLTQALFNGPRDSEVRRQTYSQGDVYMLGGLGTLEVSTYITRRLGIGGRAGGGIFVFPELVVDASELTAGGVPPFLHSNTFFGAVVGPTIEYYTKLSHFSIGADVDVLIIGGFDTGINASGYLKYTF